MVKTQHDGSVPLFLAITCWLASALGLLHTSLIAWTLKDGLGPNSVESHGWLAFRQFCAAANYGICFFVIPTFLIGCCLFWWDLAREHRSLQFPNR